MTTQSSAPSWSALPFTTSKSSPGCPRFTVSATTSASYSSWIHLSITLVSRPPEYSSSTRETSSRRARYEATRVASGSAMRWTSVAGSRGWSVIGTPGYPRDSAAARELDHGDEELVDLAHHLDEAVEVDGLGHVRVGVQLVGAQHVLLELGGGEDDHGDLLQPLVRLDLGQHLAAVLARQVEVEQDQVGARRV